MGVDINWGLATLGARNFENALARGQQIGADIGNAFQERRQNQAMSDYATNPGEESLNALARINPQFAMQERRSQQEAQQQAQAQAQEQKRADLPFLGRLLGSVRDEGSYQQARQVAQEYGIDLSSAPPNYDPNWIAQQTQMVQLMATPQGQEALSTAGKQAQDAGFVPGTPEFVGAVRQIITAGVAQPYTDADGATRLYQPDVFGGGQQQPQAGPAPGVVEDGYRFKGGNPADPSAWEPVNQGGPTSQASAGFPGS